MNIKKGQFLNVRNENVAEKAIAGLMSEAQFWLQ